MERTTEKLAAAGRFGRVLVHDVNNTLLAVRGYAELILLRAEPGSKLQGYAEKIMAEADRAGAHLAHLVEFARDVPLDVRPVDLAAWLEETAAGLATEGLAVDVAGSGAVRADPEALGRIARALADNAREAGAARLAIEAEDGVLRFRDDGPGMDADTLRQAFDPAFGTKPTGEGDGLGLAVVHGLVQRMGGEVELDSRPGAGATVTIRLPRS